MNLHEATDPDHRDAGLGRDHRRGRRPEPPCGAMWHNVEVAEVAGEEAGGSPGTWSERGTRMRRPMDHDFTRQLRPDLRFPRASRDQFVPSRLLSSVCISLLWSSPIEPTRPLVSASPSRASPALCITYRLTPRLRKLSSSTATSPAPASPAPSAPDPVELGHSSTSVLVSAAERLLIFHFSV